MSDDADRAVDAEPEAVHREIARLRRRVGRLEDQLEQVDTYRNTNAKALNRVNDELAIEKERSHALLLNVLPQPIIDRLNAGEEMIADRYDDVAIVFSDFVGFTEISTRLEVSTLVSSLNGLFSAFDAACADLGVEKIKTIGDAYMAAAGLPGTSPDPVRAAADLALAMQAAVARRRRPMAGQDRPPYRPRRRRRDRDEQVRVRPVGRRGQHGEPARDDGAGRPDPGLRGGRPGAG